MIFTEGLKFKAIIAICLIFCIALLSVGFSGGHTVSAAEGSSNGGGAPVVNGNVENGGAEKDDGNAYGPDPAAAFICIAVFLVCLFFVGEAIFTAVKKYKATRADKFSRE